MEKYLKRYKEWTLKCRDRSLVKALARMKEDPSRIKDAFYKDLEFGTAGMRGKIGPGTNCLNVYTVKKVSEGVARLIDKRGGGAVAVCYDSRIKSKFFARTAASVFASHGIQVYITDDVAPTPFLSYTVRKLGCVMGVMVTASHNPRMYNGYKVYDSTGCQILDEDVNEIVEILKDVDAFSVKAADFKNSVKLGKVKIIEQWVYGSYLDAVEKQSLNDVSGLKIVYTPLNGCGYKLVPEVLYERGFDDITIVEKQGTPNGYFTTCPVPNPEKPEALQLAIETAKEICADIVIATDPDCDRVGVAVRHEGRYVLINGNQMGVLLSDYILGTRYCRWNLPSKGEIVTTIVSTPLIDKLCAKFGITAKKVLTGFRWIGNEINKLEADGNGDRFILGFEESYGYLSGTHARDKDAVVTSMLIAEMAAVYKRQGKTLVHQLAEMDYLYGKFDYKTISKEFPGADGEVLKNKFLEGVRNNPFKTVAGGNVIKFIDYLTDEGTGVPKADVMCFDTDKGFRLIVRPSGTEPLVKFYMTASTDARTNEKLFALCQDEINIIISELV